MARYLDCENCMATTDPITRQAMGCGYEPPAPAGVHVQVWDPLARDPEGDRPLETCPGYTTALPEVRETSFARLSWKNGELAAWTRGAPVAEQQLAAIHLLDGSSHALEAWLYTPKSKGGGGPG